LLGLLGPSYKLAAIVGYVNLPMPVGYTFVANPLDADGTNSIATVLLPPDGTKVFLWDVTNQVFTVPSVYSAAQNRWSTNYLLPVGRGFVVQSTTNWTNTFIGTVLQGYLTNAIAGTNRFSLLGAMIPATAPLSGTNFTFPAIDGAQVLMFDTPAQSYFDAVIYFNGYAWFDPGGAINTNGPVINPAEGFFVNNPGPNTNWVIYFNLGGLSVTSLQAPATQQTSSISSGPQIQSLCRTGGMATLQILNTSQSTYSVQFSADGLNWKSVATNQTANTCTAPWPGGTQGYYRLVSP
jgi:hypothetical protein